MEEAVKTKSIPNLQGYKQYICSFTIYSTGIKYKVSLI